MGVKVLIFAAVVIAQMILVYRVGNRATGIDDFGWQVLALFLIAIFAVLDIAAVVWFLVAVWK